MRDHYYGFRNSFTFEEDGTPVFTDWDYALIDALQIIEDYSNASGILAWDNDAVVDGDVVISAVRRIDHFRAAEESRTSGKKYKAVPGEYFVPDIQYLGERPTRQEWLLKQSQAEE